MAVWAQLQPRRGLSGSGARVVSAANVEECWKGGVEIAPASVLTKFDPDALTLRYAMGWNETTFKGDIRFISHNGNIDGFLSFVGFFPAHDLGFVVLTNMNAIPIGTSLFLYVQNLLLAQRFGLNQGNAGAFLTLTDGLLADFAALGRQTSRPDRKAVAPWLGSYEGPFRLAWDGGDLVLTRGSRASQVLALPGGEYVLGSGALVTTRVKLGRDPDGVPHLEFVNVGTFSRLAG